MTTKIYAIRCKETGEFQVYNNRCAWTKAGNAKNAWVNANNGFGKDFIGFDEQEDYEILELTEYVWMYEDLQK